MVNASDCIDAEPAPGGIHKFALTAPPQGRTVSGNFRIVYDDPDISDYGQLADQFRGEGFEVTWSTNWTATRRSQPAVTAINANLRQYFLAGIPVTNRYQASIDWDGASPGSARFILGNTAAQAMAVVGNTATYDLAIGSVQGTGDIPISVEVDLEGRVQRLDSPVPLTLVPVPTWANAFNFQPQVQGNAVRYSGNYDIPTKPLDAQVVLPAELPYVGGTWGLLPTQLKLNLVANSSGIRETGGLSAKGGFGLGRQIYSLSASGNIYGTLTHDALKFESDQLVLKTPQISIREQVGLVSVIPGASTLFAIPIIGSLLQALDSALSVTGEVHGSMAGRGRLGVTGDTLALTEGAYDARLGVLATASFDSLFVWATVAGGGEGSLNMQIIPTPKVIDCKVLLSFQARAGAFGFTLVPVDKAWQIYACTAAAAQLKKAAHVPSGPDVHSFYGSPQAVPIETSLMQAQNTNGLTETVLAENASPQAGPLLVAGPNGRLAVVWNSNSSRNAVDAVSLRIFDGNMWGSVITVSQADRPAFLPSAAFNTNGNLLIAWAEAQATPSSAGLTVEFARSLDIGWVEVNPATGGVLQRGLVTSDTVMDFAPRLTAASDGTVWLAWQSSPSTNLAGTVASPNELKASAWITSSWGATETAGQNSVGTLFWQIAAVDKDRVWMVADVDMDGNLGNASDREIFAYQRTTAGWAAPRRLTNDTVIDSGPLLALTSTGQPVISWRHGNSVLGLAGDPANTQSQTWFDDASNVSAMLGAGRLQIAADGTRTLLWADGTALGQDVWLARMSPTTGLWSKPAPVFRTTEQRRALSTALLPSGDIMLGLMAVPSFTKTVTFDGGGVGNVPVISDTARLQVAHLPASFVPTPETGAQSQQFLPLISR